MNKSDFMVHWDKLRRHYPGRFKDVHSDEDAELCEDYYEAVKNFSGGAVFLAVKGHLEGEKHRFFPGIGQLVDLCKGQTGEVGEGHRRFHVDELPADASDYDKEVRKIELQWKDRWVGLRIKELMLGVVGQPYGEPPASKPMSRDDATREALRLWNVEKHHMLEPAECPPDVKAIINGYTRSGENGKGNQPGDGERNGNHRGLQPPSPGRFPSRPLSEFDWASPGPSCVPDWE